MAKVSEYAAILAADLAAGDLFYAVDVSAGTAGAKTITKAELSTLFDAAGAAAALLGTANAWTAQQVFAGTTVFRQSGGVAGTDEVRISHDGTRAVVESKDGLIRLTTPVATTGSFDFTEVGGGVPLLKVSAGSRLRVDCVLAATGSATGWQVNEAGKLVSDSTGFPFGWSDAGAARAAAGVVQFNDGSTGPGGPSAPARTPAQITSGQNDYSPGAGMFQRWSSDASRTVTGMAAGQAGEVRFVWNVGAQDLVFANESASSAAANRFATSTGADLTLAALRCALAQYDATSLRWRVTLLP